MLSFVEETCLKKANKMMLQLSVESSSLDN